MSGIEGIRCRASVVQGSERRLQEGRFSGATGIRGDWNREGLDPWRLEPWGVVTMREL